MAVFLDGEFYLEKMNAEATLRDGFRRGAIPPMTCLFVSHVGGAERHRDFVCNPRYTRFVAEDTVAWARHQHAHVVEQANLICGVSLSGLAAAYAAIQHPSIFSAALCQSGSFWWLADNQVEMQTTGASFWLSVGNEETDTDVTPPPSGMHQRISQIEGVEIAARKLESLGGRVSHRVFQVGHAFEPWSEELLPALEWLSGRIT